MTRARRPSLRLLVLLSALLCCTPTGARAAENESSEAPRTIEDLEEALNRLVERVERLLELAERDPRFRLVETYNAYGVPEFADRRREVKAKDLVDILVDEDAPLKLREAAQEALTRRFAKENDPDLKEKRGVREPRKSFALHQLAKHVRSRDLQTRRLTHAVLVDYFPGEAKKPDILTYDPEKGSSADWTKAYNHWRKVLR